MNVGTFTFKWEGLANVIFYIKLDDLNLTSGSDADYEKFLEVLQNPEPEAPLAPENFLEEIEARERELKGTILRELTKFIHRILSLSDHRHDSDILWFYRQLQT